MSTFVFQQDSSGWYVQMIEKETEAKAGDTSRTYSRRLRWEDHRFKTCLNYRVSSRKDIASKIAVGAGNPVPW